MTRCNKCGHAVSKYAKRCPQCGNKLWPTGSRVLAVLFLVPLAMIYIVFMVWWWG